MEIKDENEEIIPLDTHVNNCSINEYNSLVINTNLTENSELYVKIKMRHDVKSITNNILYQRILLYIPKILEMRNANIYANLVPIVLLLEWTLVSLNR